MTHSERATQAIVAQHDEEIKAYLQGEVEANVWRPEKYAEAVLHAIDYQGVIEENERLREHVDRLEHDLAASRIGPWMEGGNV